MHRDSTEVQSCVQRGNAMAVSPRAGQCCIIACALQLHACACRNVVARLPGVMRAASSQCHEVCCLSRGLRAHNVTRFVICHGDHDALRVLTHVVTVTNIVTLSHMVRDPVGQRATVPRRFCVTKNDVSCSLVWAASSQSRGSMFVMEIMTLFEYSLSRTS